MSKAVVALAALAALGWAAKTQAPELQRYLKVRRM
jgi:uncharacterized protein DUF6893